MNKRRSLTTKLFPEVTQTERSAARHPALEAERLGPCPPADALLAIATHARGTQPELLALANRRGVKTGKIGLAVGSFFSIGRNKVADFLLTTEQSYRATLLGMRHGFDVITLFRFAALSEGDQEIACWCDSWLAERRPLIAAVADALCWFADHPEHALRGAKFAPPLQEIPRTAQ